MALALGASATIDAVTRSETSHATCSAAARKDLFVLIHTPLIRSIAKIAVTRTPSHEGSSMEKEPPETGNVYASLKKLRDRSSDVCHDPHFRLLFGAGRCALGPSGFARGPKRT